MGRAGELLDRARAATDLRDFGEESFREGLDVLVRAQDGEARLNAIGRQAADAQIVDLLANRLRIEDWYRRHPEIAEEEIVAPLIGLGLPRTGSTALAAMLGEDPAVRPLLTWEAAMPCPPPEAATRHSDPRIALCQAGIDQQAKLFPRMRQMLPHAATSPMECQSFMAYDFRSQLFFATADVPSYRRWLVHEADLVPTYRYVKRVLKLLQWHCPPRRWRLKNPSHAMFVDALDQVFPDARYWMTHRDIARVIPSVADLYLEMMGALSDAVDRPGIGRMNEEFWEEAMRRMIAFRDRGHEARFYDIHFADFQADPIVAIAGLYAWLEEPFGDEARARMIAWRAEQPREKHGLHEYDADAFGIDVAALARRFAFYTDRFGVDRARAA